MFYAGKNKFTPEGSIVFKDLANFCNAKHSSVKVAVVGSRIDPISVAYEEGKRAVFNRVVKYLNMNDDQILNMYKESEDE